jgi:hypothetical protein
MIDERSGMFMRSEGVKLFWVIVLGVMEQGFLEVFGVLFQGKT